jgi:hypothetical protein
MLLRPKSGGNYIAYSFIIAHHCYCVYHHINRSLSFVVIMCVLVIIIEYNEIVCINGHQQPIFLFVNSCDDMPLYATLLCTPNIPYIHHLIVSYHHVIDAIAYINIIGVWWIVYCCLCVGIASRLCKPTRTH